VRAFGHVWLLYVLTFIFSPQMLRWHHGGSRRIPLHATNQTIKYFPWEAANVQRWPKILSTSRRSRKFITKFYWTWIQIHINPTRICTPCFFTSYREMTTISATFFDTHIQKKRYLLHTWCAYAFRMVVATNRENFPTRHKQVCICNGRFSMFTVR
jgi:hypothetical protein